MIPNKMRRDGAKGRFDPSEPLHMTTRHAARSVRVNSDPSTNGSYEDDDDHQTSFDEVRPTTSRSLGSPTSAKDRRISGTSTNSIPELLPPFEPRSSERKRRRGSGRALTPVHEQKSPVRKRKRSSPTPQPETPNGSDTNITPSASQLDYPYNGQFIEVVPPEDLSDRMGDSSPSGSDEQMVGDYLGVAESTEFTPAASEAVSPVSEDSDAEIASPVKDIIKAAFPTVEIADAEDVDDGDDLVEADADGGDEIDDAEDVDDGDDQVRTYGNGIVRRRWTGRRRADHPVPDIEATIRRQAALKSAYRAICRSLKPVLAEITLKTVEELEANPTKHEEVVEFQGTDDESGIQKQLDQALEKRKQQIDSQLKYNKQLLRDSLAAEEKVRRRKWQLEVEQMRDRQFDQLEHDMLTIARQAQLSEDHASYETDNEDGDIVPRPKGMDYRFVRTNALDPKYDSRSRLALEAERATEDLHARYEMTKMLREFKESEELEHARGFTVMDPRARNAAIARSTSIRNTNTLASAAAEVEHIANKPVIPVIPNAQAIGLQVLSDLAGRPPIRAPEAGPDMKPVSTDYSLKVKTEMHMPPPLPPPPSGSSRSTAINIINLLQKEFLPQPRSNQPQQQPFNLPGLSLSSPRRSSVSDAMTRPPGLMSPISNSSGAHPFPSPSQASTAYPGAYQPRESVAPFQHNRTVSLGTPSRPEPPRFAINGSGTSPTERIQPSPGGDAATSNVSFNQQPRSYHFPRNGPLSIERVNPIESHTSRAAPPPPVDRFNDNSPSNHLLVRPITQSLSQSQWESSTSTEPGATDSRSRPPTSPRGHSRDASASTPAHQPRSRADSMKSQSTNRDTPDTSSAADSAQHHNRQQQGAMSKFPSKLNKEQRGGRSRKDQKSANRSSHGSPAVDSKKPVVGKYHVNSVNPTPDNKGQLGRWRLNKTVTNETTPQQSASWTNTPPAGTPHSGQHGGGYYQPQNAYSQPPRQQPNPVPPPLPGFGHPYYLDPHHTHRSSLPGPGQQPWQHQPPSPSMFGPSRGPHPQNFQSSPDHWQQHQQQQQYTPLNPARGPQGTMQPAIAPTTQQYGGPTIAPATGSQDPRAIFSNTGTNHVPAFAQRNHDANARARAKSDAPPAAKFLAYVPKGKPAR